MMGDQASSPGPGRGRGSIDFDDPYEVLTLVMLSLGVVPVALLMVTERGGDYLQRAARWAVEHDVLLAPGQGALLTLPGTGGAGLDWPRILILALVVGCGAVLTATSAMAAVHRSRRRKELT